MPVTVTRADGGSDEYSRFGDAYVMHKNGTLTVVRGGVKDPPTYARGEWTEVEGDQRKSTKSHFWQ